MAMTVTAGFPKPLPPQCAIAGDCCRHIGGHAHQVVDDLREPREVLANHERGVRLRASSRAVAFLEKGDEVLTQLIIPRVRQQHPP